MLETAAGLRGLRPALHDAKNGLGETFFDFDVDTEGAVVIAQGYYGNVAIDVVLDLDDLFLG